MNYLPIVEHRVSGLLLNKEAQIADLKTTIAHQKN